MRVQVAADNGSILMDYSTDESEVSTGPVLASVAAVLITALAEAIMFLSPPVETQTTALALDLAPPPGGVH